MKLKKCVMLIFLIPFFVIYGQSGYEEFHCYVSDQGMQLQKINSIAVTTTGTTNLAIVLCVEQGQNRIISIVDFVNKLRDQIPDFFLKTTNNNYDVNVINILVDSMDTANDRAFAYELPGMLVPKPPIDTNFVAAPWMVKNVLAKADRDYNFADYDSNNDGIVDFLAFFVIKFASGWANGTTGLSINSYYTTNDTTSIGTYIKIDGNGYLSYSGKRAIIQRNTNADANRVIAVSVHELGHALFGLPDMDHIGGYTYDHYSLGHFCAMSSSIGFSGRPSPYNPLFRIQNGWLTTTTLASGTQLFSDLQTTGQIYQYSLPYYTSAASNQKFYLTYHTPSVNNYWEGAWPLPQDAQNNKRGVMIWHNSPNGSYSNKYHMPIDIVSAHGKWQWDLSRAKLDSVNISLSEAVNTSIPDPIKGLDSLETRYSYIKFRWTPSIHWWTAEGVYSDYRVGSASCFYNPSSPKTLAFYTNPNSNGALNNSSENYSRTIGSDLKMINLRVESGTVKADFSIGANANIISESATLKKGNWYFDLDITVNSGITLTIEPGAILKFASGKKLIVNGSLSAVGNSTSRITFTIDGSGNWGGIQFNSGSGGTLDYCDVTYAATGINMYNSSPTIKHSSIDNCSGVGVYCDYYSSPVLVGNNIRYNTSYGLRCNVYSSPNLTDNGYPGSNVIRNNLNGVYTAYNCNPNLNGYMTYGNSVFDNTNQEVVAYYSSTVNANKVYWGVFPPPDAEFYASSSTINRNDPLQTNPNPNRSMLPSENNYKAPMFSIVSTVGDDLNSAEEKQKEGKYDEAINLFLEVFKKEKENSKGRYALIKIEECFTQAGKKNFLDFSKKELKPLIKEEKELYVVLLELETHQLYNVGYKDYAMNNLKTILKKYNYNTEIEKQTLYRIGAFYLDLFNDTLNAVKTFDGLAEKYPDDELLTYANMLLNEERYNKPNAKKVERLTETAETGKELLSNNPNPFNPATIINYRVPENSRVIIKVYDVLGKEVTELVNEEKISGSYSVTFNASNLSSGIYFYTINAGKYSAVKKMLLLK
ncbi:MAG: T9SS type A sorting domain-containing protein [Ignavibacteriales bacterium]|nr:T9SS type A sorting domain-containing protein [Ignavibacteriales bacterium]